MLPRLVVWPNHETEIEKTPFRECRCRNNITARVLSSLAFARIMSYTVTISHSLTTSCVALIICVSQVQILVRPSFVLHLSKHCRRLALDVSFVVESVTFDYRIYRSNATGNSMCLPVSVPQETTPPLRE